MNVLQRFSAWMRGAPTQRYTRHVTHHFNHEQFDRLMAAIDWTASGVVLEALVRIERRLRAMALNFEEMNAAIGSIQADVQNVLRVLSAPDVEAQAKIDAATAALRGIDAALDAIAPDAPAEAPVTTDEPTTPEPPTV